MGSGKAPVQQSCGFHVQLEHIYPQGCACCLQHTPWPIYFLNEHIQFVGLQKQPSTLQSTPPATNLPRAHKTVRQHRGKAGALTG